jgi:hypothetical protein
MRAYLSLLSAIALVACGGGSGGSSDGGSTDGGSGGGGSPPPSTKELFSLWNSTVNGAQLELNLTGKAYRENAPLKVTFPGLLGGGICNCTVTVQNLGASVTEGTFVIQSCAYDYSSADNATAADLCNSFADLGTYTHDAVAKSLTVCVDSLDGDCVDFQ